MTGLDGFDGFMAAFGDGSESLSHAYQVSEKEPAWQEPPPESAGWSWEQWQRFASVSVIRDFEQRMDTALLGVEAPVLAWQDAEALYDRMQAGEARMAAEDFARETCRLWSGPDRLERQILRAYRLKPHHVGLVPRSVFTSEYRRRQRARVKRRRR